MTEYFNPQKITRVALEEVSTHQHPVLLQIAGLSSEIRCNMYKAIAVLILLIPDIAIGESPRISSFDRALAEQQYEVILGEILKRPPSLTSVDLADEYSWLIKRAEVQQHIPLYCALAERAFPLGPHLARRWHARCRIGVMLVAAECLVDPRSPWMVVIDGLPSARIMKEDKVQWHEAVREALTLAKYRRNRQSAKWYCGASNVRSKVEADQARERYIEALIAGLESPQRTN